MKKRKQRIFCILMVLFILPGSMILPGRTILAASAAINLSLSTDEIIKGSTFSLVLTVEASEAIKDFECFISFDTDKLKFDTGGAFVTGGDGMVFISDMDSENSVSSKKYSMKFKAKKSGETSISIEKNPLVSCELDDTKMSVSSNHLLFEVLEHKKKSKNTELKSLTIEEGELTPSFQNDINQYRVTVPAETKKLSIHAKASDSDAKVTVSGNSQLKPGENTVKLKVTAPSGDKKEILLSVAVEAVKTEDNPKNDSETEVNPKSEKTTIVIPPAGVSATEDEKGNRFLTSALRIQTLPLDKVELLPKDYIETSIVLDGVPITVYTWKYDLESNTLLVYGMNQDGESGLYEYNRKNHTIQAYSGQSTGTNQTKTTKDEIVEISNQAKDLMKMGVVVIGLVLLCMFLSTLLIWQLIKNRKSGGIMGVRLDEDEFY